MFNRSHPIRTSSPNPKFDSEDESKAEHIANLQKEYNKRLIQPLQINSKYKIQAEAAIGSSTGQFKGPSNPVVHEDTERKQLINQVKEIDRISAYHDKEAGIKRKKKVTKQKNILEQHLQEGLYNYIKAVKDRAIELKKAQIAERKLLMTEGEASKEGSYYKDPRQLFHKQLTVIKAEKDKNLKPKQLNSNSYFRYSERKMLLLRSAEEMEIVPQQDKTGNAFFREEAKKEKLRRRPVALLTKKSISFKSNNNDNSFSAVPLQNKPSQDLGNSQCSPTAVASNSPKNVAFYKAYDLMGMNRRSRNLDVEGEYITIPSPDTSTPTDAHNKPRFFGHNLPMNHENEGHSRKMSHTLMGRTSSQGFVLDAKSAEIIENREGESQTRRNFEADEDGSHQSQTLENQNYHSLEEPQNHSGNAPLIKRPATNMYRSEKVIHSKYWIITDNETKPTEEDLANKKLKENFRKNLLGNIQRAKSLKGSMLTEGDNQAMSLTIKKWPEINQPAILEQEPIKSNRPGRTLKKIKKKNAKNTTTDQVMTEMDYESYVKELQGDKVPIKEEMRDLLSK